MKDNIADLRPNPWLRPRNLFLGATVLIVALLISTITVSGDSERIAALIAELRDRNFAVSEASNPPPGDPNDPWSKWVLEQQPCKNTTFLRATVPIQLALEAAISVGTVVVGSPSGSSVYVVKSVTDGFEVNYVVTGRLSGSSGVNFISSTEAANFGGQARQSLNSLKLKLTGRFGNNASRADIFSQTTGNSCN